MKVTLFFKNKPIIVFKLRSGQIELSGKDSSNPFFTEIQEKGIIDVITFKKTGKRQKVKATDDPELFIKNLPYTFRNNGYYRSEFEETT